MERSTAALKHDASSLGALLAGWQDAEVYKALDWMLVGAIVEDELYRVAAGLQSKEIEAIHIAESFLVFLRFAG